MDDETKAVIQDIDENLEGFNEKLKFEYTDNSISFNVHNNRDIQDGYRFFYNIVTDEITLKTLDSGLNEDEINKDAIAIFTEGKSNYIVATDNCLAIPILEGFGVNYIFSHNMNLHQNHIDAINNVSVCLTTTSDLQTKYESIKTTIVPLHFSELSSQETTSTSIFDLAVVIQKDGKDGIEVINKYLYSAFSNTREITNVDIKTKRVIAVDDVVVETTKQRAVDVSVSTKSNIVEINLKELTANSKYQQRVGENQSGIDDLATAYRDGEDIPAIEVVATGNKHIIVDGFHRYYGAKKAGLSSLKCNVVVGTEEEAFLMSLGANANNKALKRTNSDKRNSVVTALASVQLKTKSNRDIANICKVSPGLVDKIVKELELQSDTHSCPTNICTNSKTEQNISNEFITSEDTAYIGSDTSNVSKKIAPPHNITEKISNNLVSLSINVKVPSSEIALSNLLADLKAMIDEYVSELEEL